MFADFVGKRPVLAISCAWMPQKTTPTPYTASLRLELKLNLKKKTQRRGLDMKMQFCNMSTWWRIDYLRSNQVLSLVDFVLRRLKFLSLFSSPPALTVASFYSSLSAKGKLEIIIFDKIWRNRYISFRLWQEVKLDDGDQLLHGDEALRKLEERARIWKEPRTVWLTLET